MGIVTIYNLFGSGGTLGISIDAGSGMDQAGNVAPALASDSGPWKVSRVRPGGSSASVIRRHAIPGARISAPGFSVGLARAGP